MAEGNPAVYSFVDRIRGARNVKRYTGEEVLRIVREHGLTPGFTMQEFFRGSDIGRVYYDWDAKFSTHPGDGTVQDHLRQFTEVLDRLHPEKEKVFAGRHGWVAATKHGKKDAGTTDPAPVPERKFKISWRGWVLGLKAVIQEIPAHVRNVLHLAPNETHLHLDLGVYKGREQLMGMPYGAKDIDAVPRFLTPLDAPDPKEITLETLKQYLVQAVSETDERLATPPGALGGLTVVSKRKGKGRAGGSTSGAGDPSVSSGKGQDSSSSAMTFTWETEEIRPVLQAATDCFGDRYRMQERLTTVRVNKEEKYLLFPTTKKWCWLKRETHASNNPYVTVSDAGARFKCHDEECKSQGEGPAIPLSQLPPAIRSFFTKMCYRQVDEGLMSLAAVECKRNISDHFPEEDDVDVEPYKNMLTALAKHQKCKKCGGLHIQFEHSLRGWNMRCNDCQDPWPRHPIPLPESEFPKLFAALAQLNVSVTINNTVNNTVNNFLAVDEPFVGTYEEDGLVVFEDEAQNLAFLNALQGTDASLSALVYTVFRGEFHCCKSGAKGTDGMWYQFHDHHWDGKAELTLRKRLGMHEYFLKYFKRAAQYYERDCIQTEDTKRKARHIKRVCEQLGDGARRKRILEDAIELFHEQRPRFSEVLDTANMLVLTNGVMDFSTFTFRDGRPEDMLSIPLKIPYQPVDSQSDDCAFVMEFMSTIQPDPETRDYLLTVLSLCITTDTSMQYFWIFTGAGANGKSKLMNFLMEALGDHYGTAPAALLTRRREDANQANESLSALEKARVAVFSEGASSEVLQVNTIKLFSGEDVITTRGLHEKQRRWKPWFKCIVVCNDIPQLDDNSWAVWRRLKVVFFPTLFVDNPKRPHERKKDPAVGERLAKCSSAFISILVEYYRRFKLHGLVEPPAIKEATQKYQTENDLFEEFRQEFIVEEKGATLSRMALIKAFKAWAARNRYAIPTKPDKLKELFRQKLGDVYKNSLHGQHLTGWVGMRLVVDGEEPNETSS